MKFAGRFIDLLGQQMYGGPVPAVAELIANAWDADADRVEVKIPKNLAKKGSKIVVRDYGRGMTFTEINDFYLSIGYERRHRGEKTPRGRPVMGRKGIGKLAGFGIAEDIVVRSVKQGHVVELTLNYRELRSRETLSGFEITPDVDRPSNEETGVCVTYKRLKLKRPINITEFRKSMARRFALQSEQMAITINDAPLTKETLDFEYREPAKVGSWHKETIKGAGTVQYWFGFLRNPISEPELRGISVFARGRLAQVTPFFFNLSGGIDGQVGLEYLTGQVRADFLDETEDCIATDRQRVNWQFERAKKLEHWGQTKIKQLCADWKKRRTQRNLESFRHDYSDLFERIEGLPRQEQEDVTLALDKISSLERIDRAEFQVIAQSLVAGVERESVKKVIRRINATKEEALDELLVAVREWDVISAVSTAEVIIGRVEIIKKFDGLIDARIREKASKTQIDMQSFIKDYPWLLGHQYESLKPGDFHHEHGIDRWIRDELLKADKELPTKEKGDARRFDLLCIKNEWQIVILELMRPGERADYDHLMRLILYVTKVSQAVNDRGTTSDFRGKSVQGLLIADKRDNTINAIIEKHKDVIEAVTWKGLFELVSARYREFFDILREKAPDDPRMKGLIQFR
ncbi:MAG: hypothetical protein QOI04_1506 [Verrucomicrobiota bacterium]|jgi:hypothetical protein